MTKAQQTQPVKPYSVLGLFLAITAFLLYANTLGHGFVLDDVLVITKNKFTTKGISGWADIFSTDTFFGYYQVKGKETVITGGRYRPLSLALFALIYQIAGAKAIIFHCFNVLLYVLISWMLYKTLHRLFSPGEKEQILSLPFLASLVFVAHPVHTEVVANIKCADELLSLLLSITTLNLVLKAYDTGVRKWAWWAGLSFLGACFSKENAFTFLAVMPLALYLFRRPTLSIAQLLAPAIAASIVFLVARGIVLNWQFGADANVLINNPFLKWDGGKWIPFSFAEKSAAIIYSLGEYLRLLVFPHPLTHDYYPRQIGIVTWGDWQVILSALLGAGILFMAIRSFKKNTIIAFALLFYIATISVVSNVFFPIGTNLSERFIFMPSVAWGIGMAYLLLQLKNQKIIYLLLSVLLLGYSIKTLTRNRDWKDNLTLAAADIKVSANSAKLNNSYAAQLSEKALKTNTPEEKRTLSAQAIAYYNKAIAVNPNYIEAFYGRGSTYFILGDYNLAVQDYLLAEKIDPQFPNLQNNLVLALRESAKLFLQKPESRQTGIQYLKEAQRRFPSDPEINGLLLSIGQ